MEQMILQQKLHTLAAFPDVRQELVPEFGKLFARRSSWELLRINPLRFADEHRLDQTDTLNLFVAGAKIGLFDFEWNLLCPACGAIMKSHSSIGAVERETIHCAICDIDVDVDLSAFVEVAFSLDPSVAGMPLNPFANYADYRRYFFSPNYHMPPAFDDYMTNHCFQGFYPIEPDAVRNIVLHAQPNALYRLSAPDVNVLVRLQCTPETANVPQIVDIDLLSNGFTPDTLRLPAGTITLHVTSRLPRPAGLIVNLLDMDCIHKALEQGQPTFAPFLTGKMLLNNQLFRDLFRIQALPRDLQLKVSNTTILFTDLKGSTALYEKTGDMTAYNLVQAHFDILKAATRKHAGAIVKTIGDAIMAAFSTPEDGVRSALEMFDNIRQMNLSGQTHGEEVTVKIGLNAGTTLAVTANEMLDYFGQSVNVAARVQGLADGGELWLTDTVYTDENRRLLEAAQYRLERQSALLKGVSTPTTVYKCAR